MQPKVAVIMGSISDAQTMRPAVQTLRDLGVPVEIRVISAHRTPDTAHQYAASAADRGLKVIIAAAGGAAHLAGVVASKTILPVIGVPILGSTSPAGLDALLSTVQMPPGVPVATVGINAAVNAALLAAQILALSDPNLSQRLADQRRSMAEKVRHADEEVQSLMGAD
ncbi:MAG: 5-(carboxyamino)imidazole ribonucleotide mutase [Armatimonadota bacterium]